MTGSVGLWMRGWIWLWIRATSGTRLDTGRPDCRVESWGSSGRGVVGRRAGGGVMDGDAVAEAGGEGAGFIDVAPGGGEDDDAGGRMGGGRGEGGGAGAL